MHLLDFFYGTAAAISLPYLVFKGLTDRRYRHRLPERFGRMPPREGNAPCLWFHAASIGEVGLIRPLVHELSRRIPDMNVVLSTLTLSGREMAEKTFPEATVVYFPLDFSFSVRRALRAIRPSAVVLVELEVWPTFVRVARRRGIPVIVVNGRISGRSYAHYRRLRRFFRPTFRRLHAVGVQTDTYARRIRVLGFEGERLTVTGNMKYDSVEPVDVPTAIREVRSWFALGDEPLLVAGSTHPPEEEMILEAYAVLRPKHPRLRLVIAPRHPQRFSEVEKIIEATGYRCYKKSQFSAVPGTDAVLLLDSVGELPRAYAAASVVFLGGTFCDRGGQNPIEPASVARPVVSGPDLRNFQDVADELERAGAFRIVRTREDLAAALDRLMQNDREAREMGCRAREVVERNRGALAKTVTIVESVFLGIRS